MEKEPARCEHGEYWTRCDFCVMEALMKHRPRTIEEIMQIGTTITFQNRVEDSRMVKR